MELENTVAVVTGAGRGIGAAIAQRLARAGARVLVSDLDAGPAAEVAAAINAERPDAAIAVAGDACASGDIRRFIEDADNAFGPVDLYVANAGVFGASGLGSSDADWSRVIDVNVMAHVRAADLLVPRWLQRGRGYFVSTASAAGLLTQIGMAPYSVSKHAAVGFAEWLSITYGDQGIGVSCLCPMGVATDILAGVDPGEDAERDLAVRAVVTAAEVMDPGAVAEALIAAIEAERFLVLPHPEVAAMFQHKAADPDRWVGSMRGYQRRLRA